jgi:hypothetical protein
MLEASSYFVTLVLFGFVVAASARMKHDMLLLACIPPVFLALISGFTMAIYAWDTFGILLVAFALLLPVPAAVLLSARYSSRDLLIAIYLAWAAGMVFALMAFSFPDRS